MILKSITPHHLGAFFEPAKIDIDPALTVFTGPNDSGKSCALNVIRILCTRQKLVETDVHKDRFGKHQGTWESDPDVAIFATLEITNDSIGDGLVAGSAQAGGTLSNCVFRGTTIATAIKFRRFADPRQLCQLET